MSSPRDRVFLFCAIIATLSLCSAAKADSGAVKFCTALGHPPGTPEYAECQRAFEALYAAAKCDESGCELREGKPAQLPVQPGAAKADEAVGYEALKDDFLKHFPLRIYKLCKTYGFQDGTPTYKECVLCEVEREIANTSVACVSTPLLCEKWKTKVCGRKLPNEQPERP